MVDVWPLPEIEVRPRGSNGKSREAFAPRPLLSEQHHFIRCRVCQVGCPVQGEDFPPVPRDDSCVVPFIGKVKIARHNFFLLCKRLLTGESGLTGYG
jgi:hypothetical protein